jgi:hypothetical protein
VIVERWRERFHGGSHVQAEAIAVTESALIEVAGAALASSDTSMERRPFVRMVGTFACAVTLEALGVDLLNLLRAMQGSRVSGPMLEETELAVLRFHQLYKELPPTDLFPHVQQYLQAVTGSLRIPDDRGPAQAVLSRWTSGWPSSVAHLRPGGPDSRPRLV